MVTSPDNSADPRWPILWSQPESFYTRPESGGMLLCACDEEVVEPDECTVDPEMGERIAAQASRQSGRAHV